MATHLPETLIFNGLHQPGHYYSARCFFRLVDYREPLAGEWFIAAENHGTAYKAPWVDPPSRGERGIVVPTFYAVPASIYVHGAPVI